MIKKLSQEELIQHVERLLSGQWDEAEMERLFREISTSVPCPFAEIQEYIFYSEGLTPKEIVQNMLNYKPIAL